MNRSLYYFGIFLLSLYTVAALLQCWLYFELADQIFSLESFLEWYMFGTILYLSGLLIIQKYYHYKRYRFPFIAGIIAIVLVICHATLVYIIIMTRELVEYYPITSLAVLAGGTLYAISLLFSEARKRPFLKIAGIFMFIFHVALLFSTLWAMTSPDVDTRAAATVIYQWLSLGLSLVPVLFIMNLVSESKTSRGENSNTTLRKSLDVVMMLTGVVALSFTLFLGQKITSQGQSLSQWLNRGPERALALAEPFEARTYVNSKGDSLLYRLLPPLHYDSTQKYPLAICLSGGGGRGTDNVTQIEGSWAAQLLSEYKNRTDYPCFVFVPQCPPDAQWGGLPVVRSVDSLVFETIRTLENEFEIDTHRRYVIGESLGGYGSWYFISSRPKMLAAAIPVCGGGDPGRAKNIVDVPVWAFHGEKDRSVPVKLSREMIEAIKDAGGNPRYTELAGEGHIIPNSLKTPGLLDWLFAQKRD